MSTSSTRRTSGPPNSFTLVASMTAPAPWSAWSLPQGFPAARQATPLEQLVGRVAWGFGESRRRRSFRTLAGSGDPGTGPLLHMRSKRHPAARWDGPLIVDYEAARTSRCAGATKDVDLALAEAGDPTLPVAAAIVGHGWHAGLGQADVMCREAE